MNQYTLPLLRNMDLLKKLFIIGFWFLLVSLNYQSPVREPFEDYKQPQVVQPYYDYAPQATDWDNLPYDDATWGWYYRLLWYLNHPNSTETPPWEKPQVPIGDGLYVLLVFGLGYFLYVYCKSQKASETPFI